MALEVTDKNQIKRIVPEVGEVGSRIAQKVYEEALRAQEVEQALQEAISEEATRAKDAETQLAGDLEEEVRRAQQAEDSLDSSISAEANRAKEAEALLQQAIEIESSRAQSAEEQLKTDLASEVNRATEVESVLRTDLNSEISRAQEAEGNLQSAIQSESTARQQSDEELEGRISDVESEVALKQNSTDNSLQTSSKTITGAINENKTEIDGLRADMIAQDHNKGFAQTAADVLTISADLNDFVYCIETGTIWVYGENGWADSNELYPSDATPLSTSTPLMDGQAEVGTSSSAARADHRHPTDTSRASEADLQAEILARQSGDTALQTELNLKLDSQGGDAKDTVVTFTDISGTAENVASGETSATLWGKVKNWFSRFKALAFKDTISNSDVASDAAIAQSKVSGLENALASKANDADLATIAKTGNLSDAAEDATHRVVTDTEKVTWNAKQDALTFDDAPTAGSANPVKSGGVKTALDAKANNADLATIAKSGKLSDATTDSTHRTVTDTEKAAWNAKQNALTFDTTPTANSSNPVTSGGVKTALDAKAAKSEIVKTSTGLSDSNDLMRYTDTIIINGGGV